MATEHNKLKLDMINMFSGAFAGSITAVITCPLDVLKTRIQSQSYQEAGNFKQQRNILSGLRMILLDEGVRGLYRGLTPTMLGYLPTWIIYFAAYDRFKRLYVSITNQTMQDTSVHIFGAVSAGLTCTLATNPLWVIKTRLMTQTVTGKYNYSGTLHAFRTIAKSDGIRGFYQGLVPSLLGVSHVAIQFPVYELLKQNAPLRLLVNHNYSDHDDYKPSLMDVLVASMLSKLIASTATYPHEVIRTRMQNESIPPVKYKSLVSTFRIVLREESWRGLYSGLKANLFRTVPAAAITLFSYEYMRSLLEACLT